MESIENLIDDYKNVAEKLEKLHEVLVAEKDYKGLHYFNLLKGSLLNLGYHLGELVYENGVNNV